MAEFTEIGTVIITGTPKVPTPPGMCVQCGKPYGTRVENTVITTSADNFCSVECRRAFHLSNGCQYCRERRPSGIEDPGWRFGQFTFYGDTEVTCPRCVEEWPKFEAYALEIKAHNARLDHRIRKQYRFIDPPRNISVRADGKVFYDSDYDPVQLSITDLEAEIARLRAFDAKTFLHHKADAEARIAALRAQEKRPIEYQRWLAGER